MAYKNLMICLFLLNAIMLKNCQVIHDHQDRCNGNVDKDLLLRVRELQLELSAYRKQSIESERRLTQLKDEFEEYKNESMNQQTELEDELKRQGKSIHVNSIIIISNFDTSETPTRLQCFIGCLNSPILF